MTQQVWKRKWTNPSVIALAHDDDPINVIRSKVKDTVLQAAEEDWSGPPYDPFHLADILNIEVSPNDEVFDARTVPIGQSDIRIEFNPHRPHGRTRFSVAHEIVHTLFPDCAESVRNREESGSLRRDEWQLELLCNIGAAEILMPSGYKSLENESVNMNNLLRLRQEFDVSTVID